jgi:hypothetical protein
MFARKVYINLKHDRVAEFTQKLEKDVLPTLRKQKGFQDEVTLIAQSGMEAFAISLCDNGRECRGLQSGSLP